MPPPPKVTPSKEMKTENIINLFDAAAAPNISVTSPTEVSDQLQTHTLNSPFSCSVFVFPTPWSALPPSLVCSGYVSCHRRKSHHGLKAQSWYDAQPYYKLWTVTSHRSLQSQTQKKSRFNQISVKYKGQGTHFDTCQCHVAWYFPTLT